jgi:hypothetical protein
MAAIVSSERGAIVRKSDADFEGMLHVYESEVLARTIVMIESFPTYLIGTVPARFLGEGVVSEGSVQEGGSC